MIKVSLAEFTSDAEDSTLQSGMNATTATTTTTTNTTNTPVSKKEGVINDMS